MKMFTEAEMQQLYNKTFEAGREQGRYEAGIEPNLDFERGEQYGRFMSRGHIGNQRKELRRLNSKLAAIYAGIKLVKGRMES